MAQVHLRRTRADATTVGRETEVARRIEFGIERRAGTGELLQHFTDRGQAGAFDVGAIEGLDRHLAFHFSALDAGAGDFDRVQIGGGRLGGSAHRCQGGHAQRDGNRQGAVVQVIHSLSLQRNVGTWTAALPPAWRQRLLCKQAVKIAA
ncbi:hypothetical protein D3C72_1855900 [compost metagenome]